MSCIVLIGGIPGSGKTEVISFLNVYHKELFKSFNNDYCLTKNNEIVQDSNQPEIHVIAFDDLCSLEDQAKISKTVTGWRNFRIQILQSAERYICAVNDIECLVQGPLTLRSEELFKKLEAQNSFFPENCTKLKPKIFFVEDNFYYRSMRYEWFQIAKRGNIGFCQIFLTCPLNVALQRNQARDHSIPEHVIKIMYSSLELPDSIKNKWEKFFLLFENTDKLELSKMLDIVKLIQSAIDKPAEMVVNEDKFLAQDICSKNVIHQADKILRKLTGIIIKEMQENVRSGTPAITISEVIVIRQKILSEIKQKTLILPQDLTLSIENLGIKTENAYDQLETILQESLKQRLAADHTLPDIENATS